MARRASHCIIVALAALVLAAPGAHAQSLTPDNGHCATSGGKTVVSCWNFAAGDAIPESLGDYPEFLPFLKGWDFRINLPHVRLQRGLAGAGGAPAIVGVVEDPSPPADAGATLAKYGHTNNALWLMRVQESDKHLYVKALPSRRDLAGSSTENVRALSTGWARVGTDDAPALRRERPAAAVVGEGIGTATVVVVARREADDALLVARRPMTSKSPSWASLAWRSVGGSSSTPVSAVTAFGDRVAIAWRDAASGQIKVRLYRPSTNAWGPTTEVDGTADGAPQLVWDGTALNLFFVDGATKRLAHMLTTSSGAPVVGARVELSPQRVQSFHALAYNGRLHVAFVPPSLLRRPSPARYTVSTVPAGQRSSWVEPAAVGFIASSVRLAPLRDNLVVVGVGRDGRLRYSRRDPNVNGPESTGVNSAGLWLTPGELLDPSTGPFAGGVDTLFFNSDIYLATADAGGVRVMNMSRAAMKQLVTGKWGIGLRWGEMGGRRLAGEFARGQEIPLVGDVDDDGKDDLLRVTQTADPDGAPAPVYVAASKNDWASQRRWHRFFSLKGEIPLVGDFNGDGRDDIATFVQKQQLNADGSPIGPAPVWVSLSDGTSFGTSRVWHRFFSLKGEIPLVGDFNGDGRDDIATFVQKQQLNADGSVLGTAPVWVSLSDGARFQTSRVWHTFFSLKGEVPAVGDVDHDGRDDIVTFLHDRVSGDAAQNVFAARSDGTRFARSTTWASVFAGKDQIPMLGNLGGRLGQVSRRPQDADRRTADIIAFNRTDGTVATLQSMAQLPYPSGAPWERYKWFTDKGQGVAAFPEWVWQRPGHCLGAGHRLVLLGAAGSGGDTFTNISARMGSRAGHVLEELGHSLFANCFRNVGDPLHAGIYESAGINANALWGGGAQSALDCGDPAGRGKIAIPPPEGQGTPGDFNDCCADVAEHYFLSLLIRYRLYGDEFRDLIQVTQNLDRKARLISQYTWLRDNWFGGASYKRGPAVGASLPAEGTLCVPGECQLAAVPQLELSPANLSFGTVAVGDIVGRTLRIRNGGLADLVVTVPAPPVAARTFRWSALRDVTIAPGATRSLDVEFAPGGRGAATAVLRLQSNAAGSPHPVRLTGRGTDAIVPQ